jgi:SAM-dependent methyltransferase
LEEINLVNDHLKYFSGKTLYGDDFSEEELKQWYNEEEQGYANLPYTDAKSPQYFYHALNKLAGFANFPKDIVFENVLGIGSAFGEEFTPYTKKIKNLTILEPSETFIRSQINNLPVKYVKPHFSGVMPFSNNTFDLITCFGVLHHIPNVSLVIKEIARCLSCGGYVLIREPITSLGDWRNTRRGLTKNERGIPLKMFKEIIEKNQLNIVREKLVNFPIIPKICDAMNFHVYNNYFVTKIDLLMSKLFCWNIKYHRTSIWDKFGPASIFFTLKKTA